MSEVPSSTDGAGEGGGEAAREMKYKFASDELKDIRQQLDLLNGDQDEQPNVISYLLLNYEINLYEAYQLIGER